MSFVLPGGPRFIALVSVNVSSWPLGTYAGDRSPWRRRDQSTGASERHEQDAKIWLSQDLPVSLSSEATLSGPKRPGRLEVKTVTVPLSEVHGPPATPARLVQESPLGVPPS